MASVVDLRSDTVTRPSPEMRRAIAEAPVGDDVLGDDPTVLRLQEYAAELLGMPAALYTPSGTMANQVAIRAVTEPGDELIVDETTHSYNYESGAPAALSSVSVRLLRGERGVYTAAQVDAAVRPVSSHFARSKMVIVEQTNNAGGGSIWPLERIAEIRAAADRHGLHLHMDGARLLNACVATGHDPKTYTQHVHSVSLCCSKGLGAPIGSLIAGSKDFITRCHRFRKMFGGGMRQVGIIAAGALYALQNNVERLVEDHINARRLAEGLAEMPGLHVKPETVETNIVMIDVDPRLGKAADVAAKLRERDVWAIPPGPQRIRAVTHLDVDAAGIDRALAAFREICRAAK